MQTFSHSKSLRSPAEGLGAPDSKGTPLSVAQVFTTVGFGPFLQDFVAFKWLLFDVLVHAVGHCPISFLAMASRLRFSHH